MAYEDLLITQPDQGDGFPISEEWVAQVRDNFEAIRSFSAGKIRTSGSLSITATSWANVDNNLDLTIPGEAGDVCYLGISAIWGNQAPRGDLTIATVVGGSPVNYLSTGTDGFAGWQGWQNVYTSIGATLRYVLAPADISAGTVTFRLRAKISSAGSKSLVAHSQSPFEWWAENRRQA